MLRAFDNVNRDMLLHKLLCYNINGRIYFAIKSLYTNTSNCVQINNLFTDWFSCNLGVRQGDTMSPTLFNIYITYLIKELNANNQVIKLGNKHICILLYADDIGIIAKNEHNLQTMLDILNNWCSKWHYWKPKARFSF